MVGSVRSIHSYARHIRGEVIAGLGPADATTVALRAADAARAVALLRKRELSAGGAEITPERIAAWYRGFAAPAIQDVMREHDRRQEVMDKILSWAKAVRL